MARGPGKNKKYFLAPPPIFGGDNQEGPRERRGAPTLNCDDRPIVEYLATAITRYPDRGLPSPIGEDSS